MNEVIKAETFSVINKVEIDAQIATAKNYPRDIEKFMKKAIEFATIDEETAESCFYCLARKDRDGKITEIKGASIRLAEIAAACWGNLHAGTRVIDNDGKYITAEAIAWDLERNVRITSQIKRSITTRDGRTFGSEMQALAGNAAASIALRNAILKVIPRALIDKVYASAVKFAVGGQDTLSKKRKAIFDRYKKMGIEAEQIINFFNKTKIEEFTLEDIEKLKGIGTAIKDGFIELDKAFVIDNDNVDLNVEQRVKSLLHEKNKSKEGDK